MIRYNPDDFEPFARDLPSEVDSASGAFVLREDANPPEGKFAALRAREPKFDATWCGERPEFPSESEYEMSLAHFAALDDWSDQEIADLIVAHRRRCGHDLLLGRRVRVAKTIAKARSRVAEHREQAQIAIVIGKRAGDEESNPDPLFITGAFDTVRREIEVRDGAAWMPDLTLRTPAGEQKSVRFVPSSVPFEALLQLAQESARGKKSCDEQSAHLQLAFASVELIHGVKLDPHARAQIATWYMVQRDLVPATDSHLTMTEAAERLDLAHGDDLVWSAVAATRLYQWTGIFWAHDQVALAEQWSDEIAQTFLAEWETLATIADRLDKEGDQSPELVANLQERFPPKAWSRPPDSESQAAREKQKFEALAHLQSLGLAEDERMLCWRVNVAAFLRGRAKKVETLYRRLEAPKGIEDLLERVRYHHQKPEEAFDQEPYLLVVKNGVVDLRTGKLVEPDRSKLLTKQAGGECRPGYTHPKWSAALDKWTRGDKSLSRWLQVAVGYSLLGLRSSGRYIFMIFGPTRTAKGTFLKIVARALGTYASPFNARAFSDTKHASHDEDLASLRAVRFAYASEMGSARFDPEKLKSASSGDPMRPSRKGEKSFEMRPECAIWMATNSLPHVPTDDAALWDRLRFVEFDHQFALSTIGDELADDPDVLAAVLAWAIEGAVEFLKNGLPECDRVTAAAVVARGKLDPLGNWFDERVDKSQPEPLTSSRSLYGDYLAHAESGGEPAISHVEFGRRLGQRKVEAAHGVERGWKLALKSAPRKPGWWS